MAGPLSQLSSKAQVLSEYLWRIHIILVCTLLRGETLVLQPYSTHISLHLDSLLEVHRYLFRWRNLLTDYKHCQGPVLGHEHSVLPAHLCLSRASQMPCVLSHIPRLKLGTMLQKGTWNMPQSLFCVNTVMETARGTTPASGAIGTRKDDSIGVQYLLGRLM